MQPKIVDVNLTSTTQSVSLPSPGADPKGGHGAMPPQTMDEKLKLSCHAYMLVLQLPLMTIKQLINIAV